MATISDLAQSVIKDVGLVDGTSVQQYAETNIKQKVVDTFKFVLPKLWWDEYMQWFEGTTDGTTGVLDGVDLSSIGSIDNVRMVGLSTTYKLPRLSKNEIPSLTRRKGYYPSGTTDLIKFTPIDTEYNVYIHARVPPASYDDDTDLLIDEMLLRYGAAWMYSEGVGAVPSQTAMFQGLFDSRYRQVMADKAVTIHWGEPAVDHMTQWFVP